MARLDLDNCTIQIRYSWRINMHNPENDPICKPKGSWPSLSMQNLKTVHTSRWKIKAVQWLSECKITSFYVSYFPKIPEYFWKKKSLELTYLFENLSCLHCLSIFVVDNVALTGSVNVLGVPSRSEGKMQLSKFKSELNWIINF